MSAYRGFTAQTREGWTTDQPEGLVTVRAGAHVFASVRILDVSAEVLLLAQHGRAVPVRLGAVRSVVPA